MNILRGKNFCEYAFQLFSQGFSFAKMAKKLKNAKVSPRKVTLTPSRLNSVPSDCLVVKIWRINDNSSVELKLDLKNVILVYH